MFFTDEQVEKLERDDGSTHIPHRDKKKEKALKYAVEHDIHDLLIKRKPHRLEKNKVLKIGKKKRFVPIGLFKYYKDNIDRNELESLENIVDEDNLQLFEMEDTFFRYQKKPEEFEEDGKSYKYYPKMLVGYVLEEIRKRK
jgi:hypothetical protein